MIDRSFKVKTIMFGSPFDHLLAGLYKDIKKIVPLVPWNITFIRFSAKFGKLATYQHRNTLESIIIIPCK